LQIEKRKWQNGRSTYGKKMTGKKIKLLKQFNGVAGGGRHLAKGVKDKGRFLPRNDSRFNALTL
jgi:hypothetical protein